MFTQSHEVTRTSNETAPNFVTIMKMTIEVAPNFERSFPAKFASKWKHIFRAYRMSCISERVDEGIGDRINGEIGERINVGTDDSFDGGITERIDGGIGERFDAGIGERINVCMLYM